MKPRVRRIQSPWSIAAGVLAGLSALSFDQLWRRFKRQGHRKAEALSDGGAHLATALAAALPAVPYIEHSGRFVAATMISGMVLDLDHVIAARSVALVPCMSMPQRPPSHSVLTVGIFTYLADRAWPGTQTELAIALGMGSHLIRDLGTGGAPIFLPRRIVSVARSRALLLVIGLGFMGRWYARHMLNPSRRRRSNTTVLAPELLLAHNRRVRAIERASQIA